MTSFVKFFVICSVLVSVSSAGILDSLFSWGLEETEPRSTTPSSKCLCQTSGCLCCVDLNLTSAIDLGGPACINIKQRSDNVTLNMSYGDNAMHNATIRIAEAANKRTCMDLLSDLAQVCAKFTTVKEAEASGYDGCLAVEPALLGTTQATYHIGCFNFNEGLIRQLEMTVTEVPESTEQPETAGEEEYNADELIAAVSASAEQGIAMFSQWLGLNFNPKLNQTTTPEEEEEEEEEQQPDTPAAGSSRRSRQMADVQQDERFKQILSAQDNIQKESAKIGASVNAETKYVYTEPSRPENLPISRSETPEKSVIPNEGLAIVSRESRRGGRAYNIHQHVNEV